MRVMLAWTAATLTLVAASSAAGYCLAPVTGSGTVRWNGMPVAYRLHDAESANGTKAAEHVAMRAAFAQWADAPCSDVSFSEGSLLPENDPVVPYPTEAGIRVYWAHDTTAWGGTDTDYVAKSFYTFDASGHLVAGVAVLNAITYEWSTTGEAGKLDVQGVTAFQVGRLLGLAPSNVTGAVMTSPFSTGDVSKRTLADDDIAALAYLYPEDGADPVLCPLTSPDASCPGTPPPRPGDDDGGVAPPPSDAGSAPPADSGPSSPQSDAGTTPPGTDASVAGDADGSSDFTCTRNEQCESGICSIDGTCVPRPGGDEGCTCSVGSRGLGGGIVILLALWMMAMGRLRPSRRSRAPGRRR